ncbi:unnamed protein product [Durusdinium trenchii]|uniref:Uncharacterized protein n=1 Tax=Durusdinium trenchii TaxID=1381693 RepID=A0ABP0RTZ2_9DINO
MEEAVVAALQRLYRGDASASAELEAFQSSAGALEVCVQLLQSTVPEVQFFGAASIAKIVNGTQARMRACAREKRGTGRPKNRLFAGHEGRCMVLTG